MIITAGIDEWKHKGHVYGECMSLPGKDLMYVYIPKNASSWTKPNLQDWGWEFYNYHTDQLNKTAIVVLRDPVDRWISGFATYASSWILGKDYGSDHFVEDYNSLSDRLIFDNLVFDDHTTPQSNFVEFLPKVKPVTHFRLGKDTVANISRYAQQNLNISDVDANVSEDHYDQQQISKFIRNRLTNRPDLIERINEQYANDFNLIDSVNFYNDAR